MTAWVKSSRSPIAIDLGHHQIKAVQLRRAKDGWQIAAAAMVPRRGDGDFPDKSELERLRGVLLRRGFIGQRVVLSVPRPHVQTEVMELPPRHSGAPVDDIARTEMARMQRWESDRFEMRMWDLPAPARAQESTHIMAAACLHEDADQLLDLFESDDWHVIAMDIEPWAIARACNGHNTHCDNILAALDLGATHTHFVLMHDKVVVYDRQLNDVGIGPLRQSLIDGLRLEPAVADHVICDIGIDCDQAPPDDRRWDQQGDDARNIITQQLDQLCVELQTSLSYGSRSYPNASVDRLMLVGGGATMPGLARYLTQALDIDVKVVTSRDVASCPAPLASLCQSPTMAIAMGLALHGQ